METPRVEGPLTVWRSFYAALDFWRYRRNIDVEAIAQFIASVEGQLELLNVKDNNVQETVRPHMTATLFTQTIRAFAFGVVVDVTIKLRMGRARYAEVTLKSWEIW